MTAFGVIGGIRGDELTKLTTENVEDNGKEIMVRIPTSKTKEPKFFVIVGPFGEIVREYMKLRPENAPTKRFFLQYRKGKCTVQVMGKNSIAKIPKEIAKFLELPNHETYTGHGFRHSSTTILANAGASIEDLKRHGPWVSTKVCESYIRNSVAHKRKIGRMISNAIQLPSAEKVVETGPTAMKRKATPMSITVESSSQISVSTHSSVSNDTVATCNVTGNATDIGSSVVSDIGSRGVSGIDTSSVSNEAAMKFFESMKNIPFLHNKENVGFYFGGQINNFNVYMKQ